MPKIPGAPATEGDEFLGWGEIAVLRGELRGLAALVEAQRHVQEYYEEQLRDFVFRLRYRNAVPDEPNGLTWAEIGDAFGISRQAAQQRFGPWVESRYHELAARYEETQDWDGIS
jgi:hypothetical protein